MGDVAVGDGEALPAGAWPTMITPFLENGSLDLDGLKYLVDWLIRNGSAGLFTVCLSSEMYNLSNEDRLTLARSVKLYAAGRVPVVASGTFGGSVEDMAAFVRDMSKEVDAVVVLVNQLAAEDEDDDIWRHNVQQLLDLTPGVKLGLYECPVPYARFISPDNLKWALSTGRFFFHKDTECKKEPIKAKLDVVKAQPKSTFRFFNANVETLRYSQTLGGDGFSGISGNFCPSIIAWLCDHYADDEECAERVQNFLGLSQNLIAWKYPACAKKFHQLHGSAMRAKCLAQTPQFSDMEDLALSHLKASIEEMEEICQTATATPSKEA